MLIEASTWIRFVSGRQRRYAYKESPRAAIFVGSTLSPEKQTESWDVNLRKVPGMNSVYKPLAD